MHLLTVLLIIYVMIFGAVILFLDLHARNYWNRALTPLHYCPFGDRTYPFREMEIIGTRQDREGILSYSLYGNYTKYSPTLYRSLDKIGMLLPTWQGRVYLGFDATEEVKGELLSRGAEVVVMGPQRPLGHEAALWRFLPLEEDITFLSLDADDEFNESIVNVIRDWLRSGQPFCNFSPVIFFVPMVASTWGTKGAPIPDIRSRIGQYCSHQYGFDEAFLKKEIWPIAQKRGCWIGDSVRLDKAMIGFWIILVVLIIYSLILAYYYQ